MPNPLEEHPTEEELSAFDHGQLPPEAWTAIAAHVGGCAHCCRQLERVPSDSLLDLVRAAHSRPGALDTDSQAVAPTLSPAPASASEVPLSLVDHPRYRILGYLGGGGMGSVFRAEHRLMDRTVALKVIKPTLVAHAGAVERFRLEMKAAARLNHPAIVAAFDAEQAGDLHFLVTEFIDGIDLERWVREDGRPSLAAACDWVAQAALGLQHAHERGMVHRDIKPSNLLRTSAGQIKILDFGLARFASEIPANPLTPSNAVVGTPDFMAPEQALSPRKADIRSDIYSLGCTLYYLLTARPPYPGGTAVQKLMDHQEKPPAPLATLRPEMPDSLTAVVARMMAKSPADRYQTPQEVAEALRGLIPSLKNGPVVESAVGTAPTRLPTRRPGVRTVLVIGLLGLVLVGSFVGVGWRQPGAPTPVPSDHVPPVSPAASATSDTKKIPAPLPPLVPLTLRASKELTHKTTWDWFERESGAARESKFMMHVRTFVDSLLDETSVNGSFSLVGGGLLKSGKTMMVIVRSGEVIAEPLTTAQAARLNTTRLRMTQSRVVDPMPLAAPAVELFDLRVEFPTEVDPAQPLRGRVSYRLLRPVAGRLCLRFTPFPGHLEYVRWVELEQAVDPAGGQWSFTAPPFDVGKREWRGPVLLLVDLCIQPEAGKPRVMLSNTAHTLLEVVPKGKPPE